MTYKEKLMIERPSNVSDSYIGGCFGCPSDIVPGAPELFTPRCPYKNGDGRADTCAKCWNTEIPEEATDDNPTTAVDIHKIVDDAMEKKDREVSIFISPLGTTVNVRPLSDEKPRWIYHANNIRVMKYSCSECGSFHGTTHSFCPSCGGKLAAPILEEKKS